MVVLADEPQWPERTADLPGSLYYDNDFRFFLGVSIPGLAHGYRDGDPHNLTISAPDGSHAHITPEGLLTQFGPRRLWDGIEAVHQWWQSLDAPSRERFRPDRHPATPDDLAGRT